MNQKLFTQKSPSLGRHSCLSGPPPPRLAVLLTRSCFFFWLWLSLCPFVCRLTGFQLPSPIVSTGSRLTLWLLSDYAVSGQGFKVNYEGEKKKQRHSPFDVPTIIKIRIPQQCHQSDFWKFKSHLSSPHLVSTGVMSCWLFMSIIMNMMGSISHFNYCQTYTANVLA